MTIIVPGLCDNPAMYRIWAAWKKSQARACQNPAEIVHFRTAKFIAVFGEHQKSKESEVDNVNPGHHETPVPAAGRVIFRGTEVGFSAASIANTAQHKPASPAARCACCYSQEKQQKTFKKQKKISEHQNFSLPITGRASY